MPAFTFEKISPPARRGKLPPVRKHRGVLAQMLDRLVVARVKRKARVEEGAIRNPELPAD